MRPIDLIVIHCADVPNGRWTTVEDIDRWHQARGWHRDPALVGHNQPQLKAIGYHFVIYTNGAVATGRGLNEIGAHVYGYNRKSIGICMIGRDKYSVAQWLSLHSLAKGLSIQFNDARIVGHRDLSPDVNGDGIIEPYEWTKTCPGFDVSAWQAGDMKPLEGHIFEAEKKISTGDGHGDV